MFFHQVAYCSQCNSTSQENFSYHELQGQVIISGIRCRSCGHEKRDNIGDSLGGRIYKKQDGKQYF